MVLKVCVGSSCHLKGSYDVIEKFKELLKKYQLQQEKLLRKHLLLKKLKLQQLTAKKLQLLKNQPLKRALYQKHLSKRKQPLLKK